MPNQWKMKISLLFLGIPICSFIISLISLLSYGIDLPYWDDWGPYITGNAGSLNLNYLFQKANDTLMPVGFALESFAFRYLNGSTVSWQFLSMGSTLGLLLLLQWRLLSSALNDRLLAASAFTLTFLMLQPYSYWGLQSQAYIQALPLVFCLASIYVIFCENWRARERNLTLFFLGLLAGFSYISGAFAIMAESIIFLSLGRFISTKKSKSFLVSAWVLFAAGLITSLTQLWVIVFLQKGTHRADIPMAMPIESNFWMFLLGNVARSLRLHFFTAGYSLTLVSVFVGYTLFLIFISIYSLIKNRPHPVFTAKSHVIFISIFSITFIYLLLLSAGRADAYFSGTHSLIQIFSVTASGSSYYFWVTLLWPWVVALSYILLKSINVFNKISLHIIVALILPIIAVPWMIHVGMANHQQAFKGLMDIRVNGVACLNSYLRIGQDIDCPQLFPGIIKSNVFFNAKEKKASFTRIFPLTK